MKAVKVERSNGYTLYWSRFRFRLFSRRDGSCRRAGYVAHRDTFFGNEKALARRNEVVELFVISIVKNLLLQKFPQAFDQIQGIGHYDDPPFVAVGHTSIELYNLSSLHMSSLYKNAQTTVAGVNVKPTMKEVLATNGLTQECLLDEHGKPYTVKVPTEMVMGGSLFLEPISGEAKGEIKFLETSGTGLNAMQLAEESFKASMRENSVDGLLESAGANASGEALKMRSETATSSFAMIDQNVARGIEQIIVYAAVWAGATWEEAFERIRFEADIRYVGSEIDLNSLISFLNHSETSRMSGTQERLSWPNLYALLEAATGGIISSLEDNQSQVASEAVRL